MKGIISTILWALFLFIMLVLNAISMPILLNNLIFVVEQALKQTLVE